MTKVRIERGRQGRFIASRLFADDGHLVDVACAVTEVDADSKLLRVLRTLRDNAAEGILMLEEEGITDE